VTLIVFGGLPGTGKSTLAQAVAARRAATYLRIDTIEHAIRESGVLADGVGPAGYAVANALAETNLRDGRSVVADCVNPVAESRAAWRSVAARAAVRLIEIEVVCSDVSEHRRRVETRRCDIPGFVLPTWRDVLAHDYEPWAGPHVVLDTAGRSVDDAIAAVERLIG
jgi:predicted kinase